jgi:hypothetical protein
VAPGSVGGPGDPDPRSDRDRRLLLSRHELERRAVERQAVVLAGDSERLAEAAGAGAEQSRIVKSATGAHHVEAVPRLERPDQHGARRPLLLANEVETPVDAVRAVDVGVPGRPEHRGVPLGSPPVAVSGGILVVVGLDLDDRTAHAVDEQRHADQVGRHVVNAPGEEVGRDHSA